MLKKFLLYPWGRLDPAKGKNVDDAAVLQDVKDCGFNTSPFISPSQFDAARKVGLIPCAMFDEFDPWLSPNNISSCYQMSDEEAVARLKSCLEKLPDDAAAIYIKDEPGAGLYPRLKLLSDTVRALRPDVEPYINLFPNYAICDSKDSVFSQTETPTYEDYLERFVTEGGGTTISLDNYRVMMSNEDKEPGQMELYFLNLIQAQDVCRKYHIPFQHVICCCQLRSYQVAPSYSTLALQAFSSLAAGAKAIGWFMYFDWGYFYCPIKTENGISTKNETWYLLQDVNRRILLLGELLFPMTFQEMYFSLFASIKGAHDPKKISDFDGLSFDGDYMVGQFDDHGETVYLIVNTDCRASLSVRADNSSEWCLYDTARNKYREWMLASEDGVSSALWIAPGCGEVIKKR